MIIAGLGYAMWKLPEIRLNQIGAVAVLVFGFFFVTVASRIVGFVGASSNPASGMTIAALLGTCLAFRYFAAGDGVDATGVKVACLSVGAIVCSAICIAGDISQDLKTGFLVRATPWKQQIGEILGVKFVPISFSVEGKRRAVRIPQIMQLAVQAVPSMKPDGSEVWIDFGHPFAAHGQLAQAAGEQGSTWADYGMKFDNAGKNGHYARIDWSGP